MGCAVKALQELLASNVLRQCYIIVSNISFVCYSLYRLYVSIALSRLQYMSHRRFLCFLVLGMQTFFESMLCILVYQIYKVGIRNLRMQCYTTNTPITNPTLQLLLFMKVIMTMMIAHL